MFFRRILFATDGSPAALKAAERIAAMSCRDHETSVTVVAALPEGPLLPVAPIAESESERELRIQAGAARALRMTTRVFAEWGLPYTGMIVHGDCACIAIAKAAEDDLCDLIAMASRESAFGASDTPNRVNLTDEVMQRAKVPVLVIPPDGGPLAFS